MRRSFGILVGFALASTLMHGHRAARDEPLAESVVGNVAISAGDRFTCAVFLDVVRCWGENRWGILGDGTETDRFTPVTVAGIATPVASVRGGAYHTCAVLTDGTLKCWGDRFGLTPMTIAGLTGVTSVATGYGHTCAVANGALFCWGSNFSGQLGDGTTEFRSAPTPVAGLGAGVTDVDAGFAHTCAVVHGGVTCWGSNDEGQLGDGTFTQRLTPVPVFGLSSGVTNVTVGLKHSCAITANRSLACWGWNNSGQLGIGSTTTRNIPATVGLPNAIASASAGGENTCAAVDGSVKCWGGNSAGTVGDGTTTPRSSPVPVADLPNDVASVTVGNGHACAVSASRGVVCWGYNRYGQIGDGTGGFGPFFTRLTPVTVWDWMRGLVLGLTPYPPQGGAVAARRDTEFALAADPWFEVPWPNFRAAGGGVHPAVGDVDGDGLDEIVLGLTGTSFTGGWIAVLDDHVHGYALLRWIQLDWTQYNAANGEVFPAVGNLDSDERAEIVAGLGPGGQGYFAIFDDAAAGFQHLAWRRVNWPDYAVGPGPTHPAVGDLDGDGEAEIVLGLGGGGNGWLEIVTGQRLSFSHRGWIQAQWVDYNAANGTTYPAAGDLDGDGKAEIVLGLGQGGGGWFEVIDDAAQGFAHLTWRQISWPEYCAAAGELHPAIGQLDRDAPRELAFGLAPHPGNGGWFLVLDDATASYAYIGWRNLDWTAFRDAGGGTFPAVGRRR